LPVGAITSTGIREAMRPILHDHRDGGGAWV